MEVHICSIDVENAVDYLTNKFECSENEAVMIGNLALEQKMNNNNLNLVSKDEYETIFESLTQEQIKKLKDQEASAAKFVNSNFPLIEGERVISDNLTLLNGADSKSPIGVFVRKTNYSEMHFIFRDRIWVENEIHQLAAPNAFIEGLKGPITYLTILKGFLSGIASGAGSKVFNMLFPSDFFSEENYIRIKEIMRSEITKDTIATINGWVTTSLNALKNNYNPQKDQKVSAEKLIPLIDVDGSIQIGLRNAIGTLVDDRYKALGLPVYILAVSALINVYEELISIETDQAKVKAHKISISLYVDDALKNIDKARQIVTNNRCNYLVKRDNCIGCRLDDQGIAQFYKYFDFEDKLNGYCKIFESTCGGTPGTDRDAAMKDYARGLSDNIIVDLAYNETVRAWGKIIEKYK